MVTMVIHEHSLMTEQYELQISMRNALESLDPFHKIYLLGAVPCWYRTDVVKFYEGIR